MIEDPKPTKREKLKAFITKRNIIVTLFLAIFVFQYIQMQSILGTFSFLQGRDSSLVDEIGQIRDSYGKFGADLGEVRKYLRLPVNDYLENEDFEKFEEVEDKNQNELQLAMFKYVEFLASEKRLSDTLSKNEAYLSSLYEKEFLDFLALKKLKILPTKDGFAEILSANDEAFLSFAADEDGDFFRSSVLSRDKVEYDTVKDFRKELVSFIEANQLGIEKVARGTKKLNAEIADTVASTETQKIMLELGLSIDENFNIYNKASDLIGEIDIDAENLSVLFYDMNDSSISIEVDDVSSSLIPFLQKLDAKTYTEKKAETALKDLEATLADKGFRLLMSSVGFKIIDKPREDDIRYYYDIYDGEAHVSSIVLEKKTGIVNIVDPNGSKSENILLFDSKLKKKSLEIPKNLPKYGKDPVSSDGSINILIAGKHGALVDTMIFAHIDEKRRDIRMISVPRDLYYNGRKINSLAYYYGMPELVRALSEITGYQLDQYLLVDMYAFIDVVDLIGGIDIHLDAPVVDPTYKTIDNGVKGTLHYEPGDYHLGGKESLRLARSRHTSSDFARAERQHMILKSIQAKARDFGFGDATTIYEIARTVLSKLETDLGLDESIAYFFRYQNFEMTVSDVMSTGNILISPSYISKADCAALKTNAVAYGLPDPGCDSMGDAYTLVPKNEDWDLIKWFFSERFE